jgi:glutamine amidotransferase PdxT
MESKASALGGLAKAKALDSKNTTYLGLLKKKVQKNVHGTQSQFS